MRKFTCSEILTTITYNTMMMMMMRFYSSVFILIRKSQKNQGKIVQGCEERENILFSCLHLLFRVFENFARCDTMMWLTANVNCLLLISSLRLYLQKSDNKNSSTWFSNWFVSANCNFCIYEIRFLASNSASCHLEKKILKLFFI